MSTINLDSNFINEEGEKRKMDGRTSISSLKFLNYIVNKVNYKTNNTEIKKKDGWKLNFDIKIQLK